MLLPDAQFRLHVAKENLKFSAAHFMAYPGFRERLHGHNYSVAVTVEGDLGGTGYVLDFGYVKRITKELCDALDERMVVPTRSGVLRITERDGAVEVVCEDGSTFVFPRIDVALLPIAHSSAEELARYLCERLEVELLKLDGPTLRSVEVMVAEAPGQAAAYRKAL